LTPLTSEHRICRNWNRRNH